MKHQTLEQLQTIAEVRSDTDEPVLGRDDRLRRWAELQAGAPRKAWYRENVGVARDLLHASVLHRFAPRLSATRSLPVEVGPAVPCGSRHPPGGRGRQSRLHLR